MWDKITQRKLIESKRIHYSWFTVYIRTVQVIFVYVRIVTVACNPNYSSYAKYACSTENVLLRKQVIYIALDYRLNISI